MIEYYIYVNPNVKHWHYTLPIVARILNCCHCHCCHHSWQFHWYCCCSDCHYCEYVTWSIHMYIYIYIHMWICVYLYMYNFGVPKICAHLQLMVNQVTNVNTHVPIKMATWGNTWLYRVISIYPHCHPNPSPHSLLKFVD